jgi:hypothetical protein
VRPAGPFGEFMGYYVPRRAGSSDRQAAWEPVRRAAANWRFQLSEPSVGGLLVSRDLLDHMTVPVLMSHRFEVASIGLGRC